MNNLHKPQQPEKKPLGTDQMAILALIEQMAIAQATDLARSGRFTEAQTVLQEILRYEKVTPATLDLLARIHAQQGHWQEAEAAWTEALQLNPACKSYQAGIQRISQIQFRRKFLRYITLGFVILSIVLAAVFRGKFNYSSKLIVLTPTPIVKTVTPIPTRLSSPSQTLLPTPTQPAILTKPTSTLLTAPTQMISPTPMICQISTGSFHSALNVRSGPDIHFPMIGSLPDDEIVVILSDAKTKSLTGWVFIMREPGIKGWINASYCR